MKTRKTLLVILSFVMLLAVSSTKIYAIMPHYEYNETHYIISVIMKLIMLLFIIAYIVFAIIYTVKSKKEKNVKRKTLIIWLLITIVVSIALYFGANLVHESGRTYTTVPKVYIK